LRTCRRCRAAPGACWKKEAGGGQAAAAAGRQAMPLFVIGKIGFIAVITTFGKYHKNIRYVKYH